MKFFKSIGMYIVIGAATAVGWKAIETLSDPYNRATFKQKFKNIKKNFKKKRR